MGTIQLGLKFPVWMLLILLTQFRTKKNRLKTLILLIFSYTPLYLFV